MEQVVEVPQADMEQVMEVMEESSSSQSQDTSSQPRSISSAQEWATPPPAITPFTECGVRTFTNTAETLDRFQIPPNQAACLILIIDYWLYWQCRGEACGPG